MKNVQPITPVELGLERSAFYLSISSSSPELVSLDGSIRIPMKSLDSTGLVKAKNLAHNQYVKAMMQRSDELDVHRATLNFLCKEVERAGNPIVRPHTQRTDLGATRKMSAPKGRKSKRSQAA